jgi:uncharacterized membrane protein
MPPANLLGILFALTSAAVWGSGDFCDGLAARRHHSFQVLVFSSLSGLVMILAVLIQETFPGFPNLLWACVAGISGALGLAALYRGLAIGCAAIVAPTSAVVGAILPVVYGLLTNGLPSLTHLAGFCLAFLGIWLVSRSAAGADAGARRGFLLACLAGVGFGGFFILVGQVEAGKVFTPLILTRCVMLGIALVLLSTNHLTLPGWRETPEAWLAGVLDAGGNVFYLLAKQYTRLDVAAVLSSLYPAATVILAALLLKERISRGQWLGAGICLLAIILITI